MTESNPKDQKDSRLPQRQQKKQWQKRSQVQTQKKKDPEEIPILKYGPNKNFSKFKEAISRTALKDYERTGYQ
jgi:hypothetical protein